MPKSILIDATHVDTTHPTGVELYTRLLLPAVSRRLHKAHFKVMWVGHTAEPPAGMPAEVEWIASQHQNFWSQRVLPAVLHTHAVDVFFTPSGIPPLLTKVPTIMTVHDLSVYRVAGAYSLGQRLRLRWLSAQAAKRAALILAPSKFTKIQITKRWRVPAHKVVVTPLAPYLQTEKTEVVKKVPTNKPLIVYIGRIEVKKNLATIIRAFALLTSIPDAHLVLAGKDGHGAEEVYKLLQKLPQSVRARIILPGYISDAQKNWLYKQAGAVVVPSPSEGFGIPLLEAYAAGVAVVAANAGALPEVGGTAARYANPYNPVSWATELEKLLKNSAERSECSTAGTKRAAQFSWEKTAETTAEAITKVLSSLS